MIRNAMWALTIAVIALVVATLIAGVVRPGPLVFAALLAVSVAVVCALLTLVVELAPRIGAVGGLLAAVLCSAIFALMVWAAPLAPGATRPALRGQDVLAFVALTAACTAAGYFGSRRRRGSGPGSRPMDQRLPPSSSANDPSGSSRS